MFARTFILCHTYDHRVVYKVCQACDKKNDMGQINRRCDTIIDSKFKNKGGEKKLCHFWPFINKIEKQCLYSLVGDYAFCGFVPVPDTVVL